MYKSIVALFFGLMFLVASANDQTSDLYLKYLQTKLKGQEIFLTCHNTGDFVFETLSGKSANEEEFYYFALEDFESLEKEILSQENMVYLVDLMLSNFKETSSVIHTFVMERSVGYRIHQSYVGLFSYDEWLGGIEKPTCLRSSFRTEKYLKKYESQRTSCSKEKLSQLDELINSVKTSLIKYQENDREFSITVNKYGKGRILTANEIKSFLTELKELLTRINENKIKNANGNSCSLFATSMFSENEGQNLIKKCNDEVSYLRIRKAYLRQL